MKTAYKEARKFRGDNATLLERIIKVVESYRARGYRMTLRQLYYQLVAAAFFANQQKNYAKLSDMLGEARMSGLVDWNIIEDRIRVPRFPTEFDDMENGIDSLIAAYRLDRWHGQRNYVEVWVEKDALSGVLAPVTNELHVRLMVNRGYSSITAMHDASMRFRVAENQGKECHILYFGDHDPSGEDMVRDVANRLNILWASVKVRKIALTMEQIQEYNPPPNPAKMTDPRASGYVERHGHESWELDALPPDVLDRMLRESIEGLLDWSLFDEVKEFEEKDKAHLKEFKDEGKGAEASKAWGQWKDEHSLEEEST